MTPGDLKLTSTISAFKDGSIHQDSCPSNNGKPFEPWATPDDLELTFKKVGIRK